MRVSKPPKRHVARGKRHETVIESVEDGLPAASGGMFGDRRHHPSWSRSGQPGGRPTRRPTGSFFNRYRPEHTALPHRSSPGQRAWAAFPGAVATRGCTGSRVAKPDGGGNSGDPPGSHPRASHRTGRLAPVGPHTTGTALIDNGGRVESHGCTIFLLTAVSY